MLNQGFKEQIYDVYRYLPPQIQVSLSLSLALSLTLSLSLSLSTMIQTHTHTHTPTDVYRRSRCVCVCVYRCPWLHVSADPVCACLGFSVSFGLLQIYLHDWYKSTCGKKNNVARMRLELQVLVTCNNVVGYCLQVH
jgi:hypothetical protein